ncbi:MAG: lactonase family protein [Planctomycetes bacterium]|nr:lactonase family protein [Planctomycetota bacterium]
MLGAGRGCPYRSSRFDFARMSFGNASFHQFMLPADAVVVKSRCHMSTPTWIASCAMGLVLMMTPTSHADDANISKRFRVYIGTYTGPGSRGIYQTTLDLATGQLLPPQLAAEIVSPSFVAIHPSQKYLYAVSEIADFDGKKSGAVSAFSIDEVTGSLRVLNQFPSEGMHPCHVIVDAAGKNALVANYSSGTVAVLPIDPNSGRLSKASTVIQHVGSSVNPQRQEGPHAHSINLDAANRFAFAADLGLDKILIYQFNPASGDLKPNDPPAGIVAPGSGPRHLAFHPSGKYVYVNNELSSGITTFTYDAAMGRLTELQTLSTLPAGFTGENSTAETVVHPSGKMVYVSNRGHDSIALFQIDPATGKLTALGHTPTGGRTPRNFNVDPTGTFLLVANQSSSDVTVFRIEATGTLTPTPVKIEVGSPVCLRFQPLKN